MSDADLEIRGGGGGRRRSSRALDKWEGGLALVVQRLDRAIHRINHYPVDSAISFPNTYPLDSDLSGG